ncbi:MAG TPA: DNA translocase FtsK 4TM domain-containing protein [Armatimonadota bacterium]|nr:DNA translocase FtsK 4TM domain-containing protein [Armatimonadota bacterium]
MAKTRRKPDNDPLLQDIVGVAAFALGAVLLVGILMPHSGRFGEVLGPALKSIAGLGAYAAPVLLMFVGGVLVTGTRHSTAGQKLAGFLLLFLVFVSWCQFARTDSITGLISHRPELEAAEFRRELQHGGGLVGLGLAYGLEIIFGRISSYIVLVAIAIVAVLLVTGVPLASVILALFEGASFAFRRRRRRTRAYDDRRLGETAQRPEMRPPRERPEVLSIIKQRMLTNGDKTDAAEAVVVARTADGVRPKAGDSEFQLPPITLLKEPPLPPKRVQAELNYKIDVIESTLEDFKIEGDVVEVSHGPTVTRYEIRLAPGIKVNKIVSLADNLAMALAAIDVRVEAPIPGKSAIGVEVPNSNPALVTLREVIDTEQFWNAPSKLTFALGKDVAGEPRFADLTKMPHMLVAGATNAGKSVCLNSLIASLLFRATPRELKFILIDPKRVELSLFDGIPHLCTPAVRDIRQTTGIFRAALKEMEHRYDLFVRAGARNFDTYNERAKPEERLPYIVIVVDELADLMMQAGPDVEFAVCRLAQLARATGIHLVIATQRPSVDIVTGTIKANISSRIAFAMNSQVDSRTILDMGGAERLIGRGDMLFKPIDAAKPVRVQGCFISEREIEALVKYLKDQESPEYTMEPAQIGDLSTGGSLDDAVKDEVYEPAVRLVVTTGYASTSMIQRRFKIGYTRAARLVDAMEQQGIVGPLDGAKPRNVLISREGLDRIFGRPVFGEAAPEPLEEEE